MNNSINPENTRYGHRCYTFSMPGVVCYDPVRGNKTSPHWCIIEIDKEITRYYRTQFKKRFGIELYAPSFDAHISTLRGEAEYTNQMQENWKYLNSRQVEIWYDSNLYWNNQHVWLNTYCQEYFDIREYYSVENWNTKDFSHLTIGKFTP